MALFGRSHHAISIFVLARHALRIVLQLEGIKIQ
jgi:hypothetical protein